MTLPPWEYLFEAFNRRNFPDLFNLTWIAALGLLIVLGISLLTGQDPTRLLQVLQQTQALQQQAAEAQLVTQRKRRHADDLPVLLGDAHEEVRVRHRLPVRLRERDRVGVVPDLLEELQHRDPVRKRRGPHMNVHPLSSRSGVLATPPCVTRATLTFRPSSDVVDYTRHPWAAAGPG